MNERERVQTVINVLKGRFNNLTTQEVLDLAYDIIDALDGK